MMQLCLRVQLPGILNMEEVTPLFGCLIKMLCFEFILKLSDMDAQT